MKNGLLMEEILTYFLGICRSERTEKTSLRLSITGIVGKEGRGGRGVGERTVHAPSPLQFSSFFLPRKRNKKETALPLACCGNRPLPYNSCFTTAHDYSCSGGGALPTRSGFFPLLCICSYVIGNRKEEGGKKERRKWPLKFGHIVLGKKRNGC